MKPQTNRAVSLAGIILLILIAFNSIAQIPASRLFGRKYKAGDTYKYRLTMEEWHSGKWDHTEISVCELKVLKDSAGVFWDEIHWISNKMINTKDTINNEKAAVQTKPYRISLDPKGRLDIPKIEFAEMTEPIEDFNTFFVAVSPMIWIGKLAKKGDSIGNEKPTKADFSNGTNIMKGEDCINIVAKLMDISPKYVMIRTSFLPPADTCLSYITPDMTVPVVADTINNFQMIMPMGHDRYMVQYGREIFYINTTIRRSDGKITYATMSNTLNLKIKVNCNSEYKNCEMEIPFAEQRNLKLEAL